MIKINNLTFRYANNKQISLTIKKLYVKKGECVVLSGESGSGKSTFTKIINGLIPHFFEGELVGEVFIDGKNINAMQVCEISQFVSSVFQDPASQFFTDAVNSELSFTCENFGMERLAIMERMAVATEIAEVENLLGAKLNQLSGGQKQKVAIATALTLPVKLILLDEPSSNLDYAAVLMLGKLLQKLKNKGYTIVIAEHRLYYLKDIFDSLLYMQDGKIFKEFSAKEFLQFSSKDLQTMGLRSLNIFANKIQNPKENKKETSKPIAIFNKISFSYLGSSKKQKIVHSPIIKNINLNFYEKDIVALVGANGVGKTTLARLLCGIYQNQTKKKNYEKESLGFIFRGKHVPFKDLHQHVHFVMQDVSYQIFGDSVFNELKLANEGIENLDKKINKVLQHLRLANFKNAHPFSLSIGQRQRLVLATTYIRQTALTILDEPTSGLDFLSMKQVAKLIKEIAANNQAVVIITHDFELIAQTCNRLLLLKEGRIEKDINLFQNDNELAKIFVQELGQG